MKKITFNTLPEAISELINRVEKIERFLTKKPSQLKPKAAPDKKRKNKRQETPAGLLSVKEAGKYLKMSQVNLYSYVKNKKIPFEKKGRRLFFSKSALDSWNKNRSQLTASSDSITIKDAAKLFKVPVATIYYKVRTQNIQPVAKSGNKFFFSKKELVGAFSTKAKRGRKAATTAKKASTAKAKKSAGVSKTSKPSAVKSTKVAKATKTRKGRGKVSAAAKPVKAEKQVSQAAEEKASKAKARAKKAVKAKKTETKKAKAVKPAEARKATKSKKAPGAPRAPKPEEVRKPEEVTQPENVSGPSSPEPETPQTENQ